MTTCTAPNTRAIPDDREKLFLGDGGICFCGHHAGIYAAATGRDLSGQIIEEVTVEEAAIFELECEQCES